MKKRRMHLGVYFVRIRSFIWWTISIEFIIKIHERVKSRVAESLWDQLLILSYVFKKYENDNSCIHAFHILIHSLKSSRSCPTISHDLHRYFSIFESSVFNVLSLEYWVGNPFLYFIPDHGTVTYYLWSPWVELIIPIHSHCPYKLSTLEMKIILKSLSWVVHIHNFAWTL